MTRFLVLAFAFVFLLFAGCASQTRAPASAANPAFARLLRDSLQFFNDGLRDAGTGQYYDAVNISPGASPESNSSLAASGMGLVSLALGDATGNITGAREKARQTLEFLLATGQGKGFTVVRSRTGWFRHWFDARTGANNDASRGDGYSTVDTAILAAGAQLAARYFADTGQDSDHHLRDLADDILFTVHWDSAVADADKGSLYLNYDLATEKPGGKTSPFNEYILVACLGKYAEQRRGQPGIMTQFWDRHYLDPSSLPQKAYGGVSLLTDWPGHYLSSFTIQFATFLCADVSGSSAYRNFLARQQAADRAWFAAIPGSGRLWGLGAGEVRSRDADTGAVGSSYHADSIDDDPQPMISPHVVAGFLPVHPEGLSDLLAMYERGDCLYHFRQHDFLWRCNLRDLTLPVDRVQAVDFSSMFLGLSSADPRVGGLGWFQRYSAGGLSH